MNETVKNITRLLYSLALLCVPLGTGYTIISLVRGEPDFIAGILIIFLGIPIALTGLMFVFMDWFFNPHH